MKKWTLKQSSDLKSHVELNTNSKYFLTSFCSFWERANTISNRWALVFSQGCFLSWTRVLWTRCIKTLYSMDIQYSFAYGTISALIIQGLPDFAIWRVIDLQRLDWCGGGGSAENQDWERAHLEEDAGRTPTEQTVSLMADLNRQGFHWSRLYHKQATFSERNMLIWQLWKSHPTAGISNGRRIDAGRCQHFHSLRSRNLVPDGVETYYSSIAVKVLSTSGRQAKILRSGGVIRPRRYDEGNKSTSYACQKEAADYRYFQNQTYHYLRISDDWLRGK